MDENENPKPGASPPSTTPVSKGLDRKTLLIAATFVSGLALLVALNMK